MPVPAQSEPTNAPSNPVAEALPPLGALTAALASGRLELISKKNRQPIASLRRSEWSAPLSRYFANTQEALDDEILRWLFDVLVDRAAWLCVTNGNDAWTFVHVQPQVRGRHLRKLPNKDSAVRTRRTSDKPVAPRRLQPNARVQLCPAGGHRIADRSPAENSSYKGDGKQRTRSRGSLCTLLHEAADRAGLAAYSGEPRSRVLDAARLAEQLGTFRSMAGVPIDKLLCCPLRAADIKPLSEQLTRAADVWPVKEKPHALVVFVAREITSTAILISGKGAQWTIPLLKPARRGGRTRRGPWLVIGVFAEHDGHFGLVDAYAEPIVAENCWMLVESDWERRVVLLACNLVRHARQMGLPVTMRKPLFVETYAGKSKPICIRPDLEFSFFGYERRLFIEIFGSEDAEYVAGKSTRAPVLETVGKYHKFDAVAAKNKPAVWAHEERKFSKAFRLWISLARRASS